MKIIRSLEVAAAAAGELNSLLREYAAQPVLLLLSGGSAFSFLDLIAEDLLDTRVTLGVLDERFDVRDTVNNYAQLTQTTFFKKAVARGCTVIDTTVQKGDTLPDAASRYDDALTLWQAEQPDGVVLVTLGLGTDGHTAGIFPGTLPLLMTYTTNVAPLEVESEVNEYTKRFTVTPDFLETVVTAAVAYVASTEKCAVLEAVLGKEGEVDDLPALLWHQIPNLTVVTSCLK